MHLQSEATVRSVAVKVLGQALKLDVLPPQRVNRAHHLDEGTAEAIEFPNDQDVFGTEEGEVGIELRPLGAGTA